MKNIKDVALKVGRVLVDIGFIIGLLVSIVASYFVGSAGKAFGGGFNFIGFFITLITYVAGVTFSAYFFYLLIDIRERLNVMGSKGSDT